MGSGKKDDTVIESQRELGEEDASHKEGGGDEESENLSFLSSQWFPSWGQGSLHEVII